MRAVAAIDLGATSGRVVLGHVAPDRVEIDVVARFPNDPVRTIDGLHWHVLGLFADVVAGLSAAARAEPELASVGVDSWAVDYALLRDGRMLADPYHYRDDRTAAGVDAVHALVPFDELYRRNGLQFLPFTTLYQLAADLGALQLADTALLIPDLVGYWLTGARYAELTNASTTGLLGITTKTWDLDLVNNVGIPPGLLPPLVEPGDVIGPVLDQLGLGRALDVITVGSHDTASAVVAVPMDGSTAAYISCGTWGLVGVELELPVLTDASRSANFTNETGVDGRVRYLHNVMGLWLLNESIREWERVGGPLDLPQLLDRAAAVNGPVAVFDPNDPAFLPPGDMATRIAAHCRDHDLPVPSGRADMTRSILTSIASAFAEAVATAATLSGRDVQTIHMVGGGAANPLLCQLTADRAGLPVVAGPVEATAIGNVLVQARAAGALTGDLETLRAVVARSTTLTTYLPRAG